MVVVCLYSNADFNKKTNSTKRPVIPPVSSPFTANPIPAIDVTLLSKGWVIEPFNPESGTIKFEFAQNQLTEPPYRYAWIENFKRFYFITGWQYSAGFWYGTFVCDKLGTFRDVIGNSTQYITRCSSIYDPLVKDSLRIAKYGLFSQKVDITSDTDSWTWRRYGQGANIICIINCQNYYWESSHEQAQAGGILAFRFNLAGFQHLVDTICDNYGADYVKDVIIAAYYCPFTPNTDVISDDQIYCIKVHKLRALLNATSIYFHNDTGRRCYSINANELTFTSTEEIPQRDTEIGNERWQYSDVGRSVFIEGLPFGKMRLDSNMLMLADRIIMQFKVDTFTGLTNVYFTMQQKSIIGSQVYWNTIDSNRFITTINMYGSITYGGHGVADQASMMLAMADIVAHGGFAIANMKSQRQAAETQQEILLGEARQADADAEDRVGFEDIGLKEMQQEVARINGLYNKVEMASVTNDNVGRALIQANLSNMLGSIRGVISANNPVMYQVVGTAVLSTGNSSLKLVFEDVAFVDIDNYKYGKPLMDSYRIKDLVASNIPSAYLECDAPVITATSTIMTQNDVFDLRLSLTKGIYFEYE